MGSIDFTTESPRFSVNDEQSLKAGLDYIHENGYAIISDVLNADQIKENQDLFWKYISQATNGTIQRDDPETWKNQWPSMGTHGLISGHGIGQSEFLWNVRSSRNLRKAFSYLWNNDELVVSFDGTGLFRDWRYDSAWKTSGGWNHVDQNPKLKPGKCCIQGFVSLTDQNDQTGGLIVYPRSHLRYLELTDVTNTTKNFVKVPNEHHLMTDGKLSGKLIHCRAGDLVLWDSRTIHCNAPATNLPPRDANQPIDLLRHVVYVCMMPISLMETYSLEEFREKRKEAVENNQTLTHWGTEFNIAMGLNKDLPKLSIEKFNDYQKALIFGYASPDKE